MFLVFSVTVFQIDVITPPRLIKTNKLLTPGRGKSRTVPEYQVRIIAIFQV